jgi:hypothetical protein
MIFYDIKYWLKDNKNKIIDRIIALVMWIILILFLYACFYPICKLIKECIMLIKERCI